MTKYKATRNLSVDMIMAAVYHYRRMGKPLKAIYASRYHYDKFDDYFKMNGLNNDEIEAIETDQTHYEFDGVQILRSPIPLMDPPLSYEFWPEVRSEADDDKYFKKY